MFLADTLSSPTSAYLPPAFVAGASLVQDIAVVLLAAAGAAALCRKTGQSVIVGYLLAGIVIGPNTPVPLIGDSRRIAELSELGLVFVMFAIGMNLGLTKFARLGLRPFAATALGALLMLQFTLMLGGALDWEPRQSLFVGAMLMVSSSAVIAKMLEELRLEHDGTAQTAMSVTILEDIVAVVMLTVLAAGTATHAPEAAGLTEIFTNMGAFVVLLVSLGLIFMPRLLRRFDAAGDPDLRTVAVAGLLLMLAMCAVRAGYSLALGAFLCGAIVAELPQKDAIERSFAPLRSVFSAVFFVSIGMLIKPAQLEHAWGPVVALTLLSLLLRPVACGVALMLVGVEPRRARRAGLLLTPLGEFTFIIAQAGVAAGVLGEEYYPTAVAVSLLTVLAAPFINRHADPILDFVERLEPRALKRAMAAYHDWLAGLGGSAAGRPEWELLRRKLGEMLVEALLVTGLLVYSRPLHAALLAEVRPGRLASDEVWAYAAHFDYAFWGSLILICLVPLVAMWRSVAVVAMVLAQAAAPRVASPALVEFGVKAAAAVLMADWLFALLPIEIFSAKGWVLMSVSVAVFVALFSGRLIYWHSVGRARMGEALRVAPGTDIKGRPKAQAVMRGDLDEWRMSLQECVVPDDAAYAGSTLHALAIPSRFGCSVVEIERNGFGILAPDSVTPLYPGDRLLLMGDATQLAAARDYLANTRDASRRADNFDEAVLEPCAMPDGPRAGRTLAELQMSRETGVRVVGLRRAGETRLNPTGSERLLAGDSLLLLGTPERLRAFRRWLAIA